MSDPCHSKSAHASRPATLVTRRAAALLLALSLTGCPSGGTPPPRCEQLKSVWVWGLNDSGQLGPAAIAASQATPSEVAGLSGVTKIAAGGRHVLVLKDDGTVWGWGNNDYSQLGDGTKTDRINPVKANLTTNARWIAAGEDHSVAVGTDGSVWVWGRNNEGQLGLGTTTPQQVNPTQVPNFDKGFTAAAGDAHTLILRSDLTVWSWGDNSMGQLGDGTQNDSSTPIRVPNLANVIDVEAGGLQSLAQIGTTVSGWGDHSSTQLGIVPTPSPFDPQPLFWPSPLAFWGGIATTGEAIAAGDGFFLARNAQFRVAVGRGRNDKQQAGPGVGLPSAIQEFIIPGFRDPIAVAAGGDHGLALQSGGTVWAWGDNADGELGSMVPSSPQSALQVPSLAGVTDLEGGDSFSVALASGEPSPTPVALSFPSREARTTSPPQPVTVTNVGSGPLTICAITTTGDFSQTNTCPAAPSSIPRQGTCTVDVAFSPQSGGAKTGALVIRGAGGVEGSVTVSGTATAPNMAFNPTSLVFPPQQVLSASQGQTVSLRNDGDAPLRIASVVAGGDFTSTDMCPRDPSPLHPGDICIITVTFTPQDIGPQSGSVTVQAANGLTGSVTLSGTGVGPKATFTPASLNFGTVAVGSTSNVQTVSLTNTGTAQLRITEVKFSGAHSADFAVAVNNCLGPAGAALSLAPNASCLIDMTFSPTASGARAADLEVATNAAGSPHRVPLAGQGS